MAETHKEIVKVWIAPGCIVCDSCETDCPEVFDVQEETCVIRPPALKADFTRPLTPSIITAAEGCPVDVIKFEAIEVEGPEPAEWAKQKEAAGAPAGAGAEGGKGGGGAAAAAVSYAPPDPKWMQLLEAAHVSGSRSAGGPRAMVRTAKVQPESIQQALPVGAPPDAQFATMVGTGYTRPGKSVAERIRERAEKVSSGAGMTRRGFGVTVAAAWGALVFVGATSLAWFQSFMIPKAPILPPTRVRVGKLTAYTEIGVYEDYKPQNIWVVTLEEEGIKKVVAINTVCTHLGCIPNWLPAAQIFKCPCHGSGFRKTGINFEGPAPRPLERFKVEVDATGTLIVDKGTKFRQELGQWSNPAAQILV
ncbi:MAG: Rieske 2Fe-2S domain-containing protein [Phycisphaerales bacterium]|nr:Rieske 2Fe-2S domain-containing protein [Phycisphaerales bacterium]